VYLSAVFGASMTFAGRRVFNYRYVFLVRNSFNRAGRVSVDPEPRDSVEGSLVNLVLLLLHHLTSAVSIRRDSIKRVRSPS
jgi:hypothetical protein